MITIPAGELTGLLSDVVPFALPDEKIAALCAVRIEWDGELLHTFTHDGYRVGWAQWCPDDPPPGPVQDQLGVEWGGADEPWAITLRLADAQEVVAVFKAPKKDAYGCPLTLELVEGRLKVVRARDRGWSALTGVWEDNGAEFEDLRNMLSNYDRAEAIRSIAYTAALLADFELVRPRGPMRLTFTGEEKPTLIEIGQRFLGAIMPTRTERRIAAAGAADPEAHDQRR